MRHCANRRRNCRRELACEPLESRCLLSASGRLFASTASASLPSDPTSQDEATPIRTTATDTAGQTPGTARPLGALQSRQIIRESVSAWDTADYYRFSMERNGTANLQLVGLSADVDIYLLDANGQRLARSIRPGRNAETIRMDLDAGNYFIRVVPYRRAASGYWLIASATLSPPPPPTPPVSEPDIAGDTMPLARNLGVLDSPQRLSDTVGASDSSDFFRFRLTQSSQVDIELGGLSADIDLYLRNASGQQLARSVRAGSAAEAVRSTLPAGDYYVQVAPYRSATSPYNISLAATPVSPPPANEPPAAPTPTTPDPPPTPTPANPPVNSTPPSSNVPVHDGSPLPNVAYFGGSNDWNLNLVNAPEAWGYGYTGDDVVVAVVDTGIDLDHPDLAANLWRNNDEIAGDGLDNDGNGYVDDVRGYNFANNNNDVDDDNGHGTHVAGTIAAIRNGFGATGVAYDATIMPVRVLGGNGSGSSYGVAQGIRYAVDNGADVINLSLGGGFSSAIQNALQYAMQRDVFVAIASGNEYASRPSYPAQHANQIGSVLSVGAHDSANRRASFSNQSNGTPQIDAPGSSIYSTLPNNRYGRLSGTSMAAPHVAGVAALILSANPEVSAAQLRNLLVSGANRAISGSDASGGINGATSIGAALAGLSLPTSGTANSNAVADASGQTATSATRSRRGVTLHAIVVVAPATSVGQQSHDGTSNAREIQLDSALADANMLETLHAGSLNIGDTLAGDNTPSRQFAQSRTSGGTHLRPDIFFEELAKKIPDDAALTSMAVKWDHVGSA